MSLIDPGAQEKDKILRWATEQYGQIHQKSLLSIEKGYKDTYYKKASDIDNIIEYDIKSAVELEDCLNKLWEQQLEMKKIVKVCVVAAFKGKEKLKRSEDQEKLTEEKTEIQLLDFIYNF